ASPSHGRHARTPPWLPVLPALPAPPWFQAPQNQTWLTSAPVFQGPGPPVFHWSQESLLEGGIL
ncbi:hypothetical protein M9458_011145, partial [Cirrhinus mrigala]